MFKIICPLLGVSFQTEIIIMTLLDSISSLRDWKSPFNWTARIHQIWKTTMSKKKIDGNYDQYIKIALSWVVISRMIIAHLYTMTYAANFYTILTWSRGKILLPWLMLSAFKNFFLESIIILVIIILYTEGNLSGFLFMSIMTDKLISFAIAAHNWFTIKSLYLKLEKKSPRKSMTTHRKSITPMATHVMIGMSVQNTMFDDNMDAVIDRLNKFPSLPNLDYLDVDLSSEFHDELHQDSYKSILTDRQFDEVDEDDFHMDNNVYGGLTTTEKVRKILGLNLDDIQKVSAQNKFEMDEKSSLDSISTSKSIRWNGNDDSDDNESSSCKCLTLKDREEDCKDMTVESNRNLLTKDCRPKMGEDENNKQNIVDDDSDWVNQWSLEQLLKYKKFESIDKEDRELTPIVDEDYFSRWSSDENLDCTINSGNKPNDNKSNIEKSNKNSTVYCLPDISFAQIKRDDYYEQSSKSWTEHLQITGSSYETTLQYQQIDNYSNKINEYYSTQLLNDEMCKVKMKKSWILDGMCIELVDNNSVYSVGNENLFVKPEINLLSVEMCDMASGPAVQTNFGNQLNAETNNNSIDILPKSLATQTSLHELMLENSYYTSLSLNNSAIKKNRTFETADEREEKELTALKAYNAKTLWKDKQKRDVKKLKVTHEREMNLLKKSESLKPNTDSELIQQKQRYQINNLSCIKKVLGNLKINSVSCKKIQVTQLGRHLHRIKASENILSRYPIKTLAKLTHTNTIDAEYSTNKLSPRANPHQILNVSNHCNIKNKIAQLDWTLSSWEYNINYGKSVNKSLFIAESSILDIIDEIDTARLLQCAFSFDSRNTERGFHLGPASTDFYSVSQQIPNVFREIIKTACVQTICYDFNNLSTREIDFGEIYYQELISVGGNNEIFKTAENVVFPTTDFPNQHDIFIIDCWLDKLHELLNSDRSSQVLQKLEQLIEKPRFFIIKQLINKLYSSKMISVSIATSRPSIAIEQSATSSTATINNNSIG